MKERKEKERSHGIPAQSLYARMLHITKGKVQRMQELETPG